MSRTAPTAESDSADIEAALGAGDRNLAIELAITALGEGRETPLVLRLVADGLEEDGRPEDAATLLQRATVVDLADVQARTNFGRVLGKLGRWPEALAAQQEALAIDPDAYEAHVNAGVAWLRLGDVSASLRHYRRAAELSPGEAEPLSALAVIAARQGDSTTARTLGERALIMRPDFISAHIAIARADLSEGAAAAAKSRLERLLARPDLNEDQRADGLSFLADALDAVDRPAEAFAFYTAENAILLRSGKPARDAAGTESNMAQARRLADYFEAAPAEPWRSAAGDDREGARIVGGHVFLLGFPRSGTTLLEQVLASHPRVVALEERGMLSAAGDHFLLDEAALGRLATLGQAGADACREIYWRDVHRAFKEDITGKVFIDKLPLHTLKLPLIAKLFPKAKIIFALRDPRDVVLSCFRRRFKINAAMYEFLTLDGTARYYDQVMRLADIYRAKLTLDIHTLRHEELVADFEGEVRETLSFVGVSWDAAVMGFATRAASSLTPSAVQVARGLNAEGVGQWRRYQRQLAPVLPLLEPWAKRFGYPPAEPGAPPEVPDARLPERLATVGAAVQAGDWTRAFSEVDRALAEGLRHPLFLRLRGVKGQREGRLDQAIADFEAVLADAPGDFATLNALGLCLARIGRPAEGLDRLDMAIAINPTFAPAHFNRGWTLESLGDLGAAKAAYARALTIDPAHAQALGGLAVLALRAGDPDEARRMAGEALRLDPLQPAATMAMAEADCAQGAVADGEGRIRAFLESPRPTPHERAVAHRFLGDILDSRARYDDAFAAYDAGARGLRELLDPRIAALGWESASTLAGRLIDHFESADPTAWRPSPAESADNDHHLFLVGFPGSEATLAARILAGRRDVVALESGALAEAARRLLGPGANLDRLARLTPDEAAKARELYWRAVRATGIEPGGRLLLDTLPMNGLDLPVVAKLFPRARILVMRRDPRDVVFNAFRRWSVVNPTTVDLLTLEGAARLYDLTMKLMILYEAKLGIRVRVQGYEVMIADHDGEARALCEFAGLEWTQDLANFAAGAGVVATSDSTQSVRGPAADGIGHWRCYREHLAAVRPLLEPWVQRFGYCPD
ncbi:MAG TPA: sulfotransferase [Caulobacteraceae bacterium]|nr:sulfotransferase [Caulobacteraceae bacterium]